MVPVEQEPTRTWEAAEDVAQRGAIAAPDIDDQPRARKVTGCGNGCMPVVGEMRHHGIEDARLVWMRVQVLEATRVPSRLVGAFAHQGDIQLLPSAPGAPTGPEPGCIMQAVRRIRPQQA